MTLHLFVDTSKELLVHAFRGDERDANRFTNSHKEHQLTHIRIENGIVHVGEIK